MVDLNFHCCICGEENDQSFALSGKYETEIFLTNCQYCKEPLELNCKQIYKVVNVDNQ